MQRTDFGEMVCSIARTLDVIGEPWSPLILRDVWVGFTRFEQIQADLGISRKVLTERLNPTHTSRTISGDQGSPMTSSVRAIEHAMSPKFVRCMGPV